MSNFVLTLESLLETAGVIATTVGGADPRIALGVALSNALLDAIKAGHKVIELQVPAEPTIEQIALLKTIGGMKKTGDDYLEEARQQNP